MKHGIMRTLEKHLKEQGADCTVYDNSDVWLTMPGRKCDYDIGFSADDEAEQIYMFLDFDMVIPKKYRSKVAEFIIRINNLLPLGGFTLNMEEGFVQFKLPNLLIGCDLTVEFIGNMIAEGVLSTDNFYDGFLAVTAGGKSPKEACRLAVAEMDMEDGG